MLQKQHDAAFDTHTTNSLFILLCDVIPYRSCCSKVVTNNLAADGNSDLTGYWGGFSGDVDGKALGFLSPFFNGDDFHGKAVQVGIGY